MDEHEQETRPRIMERHIQTILVIGIAALMTWMVYTTNESSKEIIRLHEKVAALVDQLKAAGDNNGRINDLELRVGILEERIKK